MKKYILITFLAFGSLSAISVSAQEMQGRESEKKRKKNG